VESTDQPYRLTEIQPAQSTFSSEPSLIDGVRQETISGSRVYRHLLLLLLTAVTTTFTGAAFAVPIQAPASFLGQLIAPMAAVINETAAGNLLPLANGLLFTFTLLVILGAHELGHYFACRYYRIKATLPFFLPAPPTITLFGTFGAVIKIKEPISSRRALFDIGIAGPLAGFMFALPAAVIGLYFSKPAAVSQAHVESMWFNDPLLFSLIIDWLDLPKVFVWNPVYWAAWGSMLVTALNLFPVGQLDGGHVLYSIFGRRAHRIISVIATLATASLAILAFYLGQPPVYMLWAVVLLFLLKIGHPPVIEDEPLGWARTVLAIIAAIVFALCFLPFPITTGPLNL
jgi:membrane-associated protease RseP (regulator of RpoE activity)